MIDARLLNNLIAWSAQVTAIVAVGSLALLALQLRVPRLRHAYWRLLLALCVALPLLQIWQTAPVAAPEQPAIFQTPPADPVALTVNLGTGRVASNEPVNWPLVAGRVIVAGMVLRLLWTAIGLWRLRGLRRAGTAAGHTEFADVKALFGVAAEIRYVRSAEQPVTFGLWRPVVILPDSLRDHPDEVQRAVVSHELCHVKRHDWAWLLVEETVRAALWFHPAIWWVVSRIQLTREEAVDAGVVAATGQRRVYAQALMAFADEAPLTPVAAFSRRRHLFTRLMLISKEAVMSSKRIAASSTVLAAAVAMGGWFAVDAFPLQGSPVPTAPRPGQIVPAPPPVQAGSGDAGPLERQAKPITPENPIPRRTYSVPVQRPFSGPAEFVGALDIRVTLDASGRVAESRLRIGAKGAYADAALQAIEQWRYDPPAEAPISFNVAVFVPPSGDIVTMQQGVTEAVTFGQFRAAQLSIEGGQAVARGGVRVGGVPGGVIGGAVGGVAPGPIAVGPTPPPAPGAPIRVGGAVMQPARTVHVNPEYPAIARSARVQGVVIVELVINTEGRVQDARVLRSIPLLDQAALDAVRQWEFTPTLLNGQPTPVIMTATVQFSLPDDTPQPQALLHQGLVSSPWRLRRVLNMFFPAASAAVDRERQ